jgi:hypothetical protein
MLRVATRIDYPWLILDNLTLTLVRDSDVTRDPGIRARPWRGQAIQPGKSESTSSQLITYDGQLPLPIERVP